MRRILVLVCLFCTGLFATPKQVIVIRHGEKPAIGKDLNEQGRKRAKEMPRIFKERRSPDVLFAFKSKGNRGKETLSYLASKLDKKVQEPFSAEQVHEMAKLVLEDPQFDGKVVLICWEHKNIKPLIEELHGPSTPSYPGDRFDLVYLLSYDEDACHPHFCMELENLLPSDQDKLPSQFASFSCTHP